MGPIFERTIQMSKLTLSSSLSRLGTETAYAVSEEAKAHAAAGNKVYSMHIGDLNFPTPQCIKDAANGALEEGKTGYLRTGLRWRRTFRAAWCQLRAGKRVGPAGR